MELSMMLNAIRARLSGDMDGSGPHLLHAMRALSLPPDRSEEEARRAWDLVRLQGPLVFFTRDPEDILSEHLCKRSAGFTEDVAREVVQRLRPTFYAPLEGDGPEERGAVYRFFYGKNYEDDLLARLVRAAELWMEDRDLAVVERALSEAVNRPYNKNFEQVMLAMYERWTRGSSGPGKRRRRRLDHEQYQHVSAALARREAIANASIPEYLHEYDIDSP